MMTRFILSLCAACLFMTGCATTQQLNATDRTGLGAVKINPVVEKPPKMYYMGPASGIGFMFGAVGGLLTAAANMSPGEQFRQFAEDNGVTIDRIAREEAAEAFGKSGKLTLTESDSPDAATLNVAVQIYGFAIPHGFSGKLVPVVGIKSTLVDSGGKTIWSSRDSVSPLGSPVEGRSPDDFKANPKLIEDAWRTATKTVMANIVGNL